MSNVQEMVREFHETFGLDISEKPSIGDDWLANLRKCLIMEEAWEVEKELNIPIGDRSLPKIAKELADLVYVAYGAAISYGIDLDMAIKAVHESNMSKLDDDGNPVVHVNGKILKGKNYFEPDMQALITEMSNE